MLPDRVSNPGPLTYESGALPIALRGPTSSAGACYNRMIVGQGPIAFGVGTGGVVWTFVLSYLFSPLSPSLWETARCRLKCCLEGPLNPKQTTN